MIAILFFCYSAFNLSSSFDKDIMSIFGHDVHMCKIYWILRSYTYCFFFLLFFFVSQFIYMFKNENPSSLLFSFFVAIVNVFYNGNGIFLPILPMHTHIYIQQFNNFWQNMIWFLFITTKLLFLIILIIIYNFYISCNCMYI